jgi:hypothetical protein
MTRLANMGPAVKTMNPKIHGSRKMNAQRVSESILQRSRRGALELAAVTSAFRWKPDDRAG